MSEKVKAKEIVVTIVVIIFLALGLILVSKAYNNEGEKRSAAVSDLGEKDPNHIEVDVTLISIDPTKGDIVARLEFLPKGIYTKDEGLTLARDVKLFVNGATGKQETDFPRGKKMNPMEVVVQMYGGLVTDYPFDKHNAYLEVYFVPGKEEKKSGESTAAKPAEAAPSPTPAPESAAAEEPKKEEAAKKPESAEEDDGDEEIPIGVDFSGSISGFRIEAAKAKESQNDLVGIDMTISRSTTTKFFSFFVMIMMWGLTISVLFLTASVVLRGRKPELGMFSFTAALLFAFATVRNAQPGTPPIGTYSDFISFFWAEVIIALCLVVLVFAWLLRPAK